MYKYKTKDGKDAVLPGIGITVNGIITTPHKIENPNFEQIFDDTTPAPNHVTGVAPQNVQPTNPNPASEQTPPTNTETA